MSSAHRAGLRKGDTRQPLCSASSSRDIPWQAGGSWQQAHTGCCRGACCLAPVTFLSRTPPLKAKEGSHSQEAAPPKEDFIPRQSSQSMS